jgi:GTPase KRas protein
MRTCQGFLIVYAITDRESFAEVDEFVQQILRVKDCDHVPIVIVGNKCDLESERDVKRSSVEMYATKQLWKVPHLEASAKLRVGIDEAFTALVREIRKTQTPKQPVEKKKLCKIL